MLNIVFGSIKKIAPAAIQQFDFPSMKLEANRGKGTTRRVLFNKSACRLLELDAGGVQELLFGFAQPQGEDGARLFVINTAEFVQEVEDKTYKVSKNYATYDGDTTEKGKTIGSTQLCSELRKFVGLGDDTDTDYEIILHDDSGEAPIYELVQIKDEPGENSLDSVTYGFEDAPALEVNCDDCEDDCAEECPVEDEVVNEDLNSLIDATEDFDGEEEDEDDDADEDEDEGFDNTTIDDQSELEDEAVSTSSFHIG